mmetsp:Transcript_22478/g.59332  ORF Transcript_22478/g.59332 Transcript_22478/m.59332 type:complete len:285 (+) Transcript_22478:469-1323(+)
MSRRGALHALRQVVDRLLELPLEAGQLRGLGLRDRVVARAAGRALDLRDQQRGVLCGPGRGRLREDGAFAARGADEAPATVRLAGDAALARAPEALGVVQLHAAHRRRLQQAALRQVRDADLVAHLDVPAGAQDVVGVCVVPHRVREAGVRHEGREEVGGVALRSVRVLEAVQDPDLDQPLQGDPVGRGDQLLHEDLRSLARLLDVLVVEEQQVPLGLLGGAGQAGGLRALRVLQLLLGEGLQGAPVPQRLVVEVIIVGLDQGLESPPGRGLRVLLDDVQGALH